MIRIVLSTLLRHWRRAPLQLFALLAGLAIATGLWSGVQAINAEARASYDTAAASAIFAGQQILVDPSGETIPMATFVALRRAGWLVSPIVEAQIGDQSFIGVDPLTLPLEAMSQDAGSAPALTELIGDAGVIWGDPDRVHGAATLVDPAPAVIEIDAMSGQVFATLALAQSVGGVPDAATALILLPDQPLAQQPLEQVAPMLELRDDAGADVSRLTDSFHLNLTAFGFLSFAVGLFIVNGAIGLAFEQRRSLVRTMRALGVPLRTLIAAMLVELAVLGLAAGAIGVAMGYLLAGALLPDVAATLRGLYGAEVDGTLSLRPVWWASGLAIAILGTGAAAGAALWAIARMPILASARPRAWATASGQQRMWQGGVAAALLLVGLAFLLAGQGLASGFAVLACLLIGSALVLPLIIDGVLRVAEWLSAPGIMHWFWADTRQQLPRLSLAFMALLLAMAANVGVATMVQSFRLTFTGFLDQRLASELYVQLPEAVDASAFETFALAHARSVLPIVWVDQTIQGQPAEVYGARNDDTYRDNWRFLDATDDPWEQLSAGDGALVSEQLARRGGIAVGDRIEIAPGQLLPVVGVHGDYGNPIGQVIVGETLFAMIWPDEVPRRFGVRIAPEAVPAFIDAARGVFDLRPDAFIDQAGIKSLSLAVFDRTFLVTDALNVLTLFVAGFAILMALLTLSALRVPQLAPAWAMGVTRRALGGMELGRALMLSAITGVLAVPLGLALSWVLLAVVNVEAFGWRLPMFLFPLDYLRLLALSLLAATIAALWPALRLGRARPADLLRVFSLER